MELLSENLKIERIRISYADLGIRIQEANKLRIRPDLEHLEKILSWC